jgi:hypothetical protein
VQATQPNDDTWTILTRGHYMLLYTDRLRQTASNEYDRDYLSHKHHSSQESSYLNPYPNYQFALPVDFSLFTFNHPSVDGDDHLIYVLLSNLYSIVSIAASCGISPIGRSNYEYLLSQHDELRHSIRHQGETHNTRVFPTSNLFSFNDDNIFIMSVRLSTFILTSYLLSSSEEEEKPTQETARLATRLRTLLSSSTGQTYSHTDWMPFPGASVWCYAIGIRFADPQRDRTWFLMQFLRVAHMGVLETWDETSRSLEAITCGLERIRRVNME